MSTAMEQVSKMSEDRMKGLQTPVTYGNALGAQGNLTNEPITLEDASLMQSAEARTFGQTEKEGAASIMQAAAQENIRRGLVKEDAHSAAAEEGVVAERIMVPGMIWQRFVGNALPLGDPYFTRNLKIHPT